MKRIIDIILTIMFLIILLLPMSFIIILIRVNLGSPVFFCQMRAGLNGEPFRMYKFRSMTDDRDSNGCLLPDMMRITRFGNFLRASSLDELPELLNVLRGEMSLVGPRPLLVEYLNFYNEEQHRRHLVRPGVTGWAQVNGRNSISWEEKFRLDVWYVDNNNLLLDFKILLLTIKIVLLHDAISSNHVETMPKFEGRILDDS